MNSHRAAGILLKLSATCSVCARIFLSACVLAVAAPHTAFSAKPNILIILADDLGYGDVRAYNPNAKTVTPNLDSLAAQGMRFTDAHSPAAVCSPTRYALLTGRYAWRSSLKQGVLPNSAAMLIENGRDTLGFMLKRNGYRTACIGKWHLGMGVTNTDVVIKFNYLPGTTTPSGLVPGPNDRGFDHWFGINFSLNGGPYCYMCNGGLVDANIGAPVTNITAWQSLPSNGGYPAPFGYDAGRMAPGFDPENETPPRFNEVPPRLNAEVIRFIGNHVTNYPSSPFFIYYAVPAPHTPWVPDINVAGMTREQVYIAYVNQLDTHVGQVLQTLASHNLVSNTIVFFTSDNGPELRRFTATVVDHYPNLNWRGMKGDAWEAGHREPFIARWPGHIPAGSVSHEVTTFTDLYRTLATLVEDAPPPGTIGGEDSVNLLPILLGPSPAAPLRSHTIHHSDGGRFAIRIGHWKYIDWPGSGGYSSPQDTNPEGTAGQLFDLAADPGETNNLYSAYPARVTEMKALLTRTQNAGSNPYEASAPAMPGTLIDFKFSNLTGTNIAPLFELESIDARIESTGPLKTNGSLKFGNQNNAVGELNLAGWNTWNNPGGVPQTGWLSFKLAPDPGHRMSLQELTVRSWRDSTNAPQQYLVRASTDNFTANRGSSSIETNFGSPSLFTNCTISLSGLTNLTNEVEIRLYALPVGADSFGNGGLHVNKLTLNGVTQLDDADSDGLSDFHERYVFDTASNNPDSDGDGQSDGLEVLAGTNPLNAQSYFNVTPDTWASPVVQLSWPSRAGNTYRVNWNPILSSTNWLDVSKPIIAVGSNTVWSLYGPLPGFYRVRLTGP